MLQAMVAVLVAAPLAWAQPGAVDPVPSAPAPAVAEVEAYSRSLVDRPLVLPESAFESLLGFAIGNDQRTSFVTELRFATPVFELQAGFGYQLTERPTVDTDLRYFYVGGTREIIPCRIPGLVAGAQLVTLEPAGDLFGVAPSLHAGYKRAVASRLAIESFATFGYAYGHARNPTTDEEATTHQLASALRVRVQLQATTAVALVGLGALRYVHDLESYTAFGLTSHGTQELGLELLLAAGSNVDLRASYVAKLRDGDNIAETILLGLAVRRVP